MYGKIMGKSERILWRKWQANQIDRNYIGIKRTQL